MKRRALPVMARLLVLLALGACSGERPSGNPAAPPPEAPADMVYLQAGTFTMGSSEAYAEGHEGPELPVAVDAFYLDRHEVTNAQFAEFVEATGYVTVAERPIDWETLSRELPPGTPRPPDSLLAPGSLVFAPPLGAVSLHDYAAWWSWVPGASWKHPEGPQSSIADRMDHPVTQVAWEDAAAYAKWAGKRLPTEAEWEYASRAGGANTQFAWGEELTPGGTYPANFFQGEFPHANSRADGFAGTAPVQSFPPNAWGLYDMIGNVWEWTADWYRPDTKARYLASGEKLCYNPTGPASSFDPADVFASAKRVIKGGSFLCSREYCSNYRPASRMATSVDSGQNHLGFRCAKDVE